MVAIMKTQQSAWTVPSDIQNNFGFERYVASSAN